MIVEFFPGNVEKIYAKGTCKWTGFSFILGKKNVNLNWTTDYQSPNDIVKVDMTLFEIISNIGKQSYGQFDIINQDIG